MLMKFLSVERNAKQTLGRYDDEDRIVISGTFRIIKRIIERNFPEVRFFEIREFQQLKKVDFASCSIKFKNDHAYIDIRRCGIKMKLNSNKELYSFECCIRSFKDVLASLNECASFIESAFALKNICYTIYSRYHCLLIYKYLLVVWKTGMTRDLRILLWSYLQ